MAEFREEFLTNATAVLASEAYERYRTLAEAKKPANVLGCGILRGARLGEATRVLRHPKPSEQGLRGGDDHSRRVPGTEPPGEGPGPQERRGSRETDARLRGSVRQEEPLGTSTRVPFGIPPTRTTGTRTPRATRIWRGRSWSGSRIEGTASSAPRRR